MTAPILLVEDHGSLAEMLEETLRRVGWAVETVARGDEAAARLASGDRYLAVLTDLRLPGATGLDVLAAARRPPQGVEPPAQPVPVGEEAAIDLGGIRVA